MVRLQSGGRSSYDPAYPPHRQPYQQLCSMDDKLSGTYGAYWRQFEGIDALPPAKPKPHRTVHMVPDDRADEQIDFETVMNKMISAFTKGVPEAAEVTAMGLESLMNGRGAA